MTQCAYCGVEMHRNKYDIKNLDRLRTKDHVIPRSRTAAFVSRPCVWCCHHCNQEKADLTLFEWRILRLIRERRIVVFYFERALLTHLLASLYAQVFPWVAEITL